MTNYSVFDKISILPYISYIFPDQIQYQFSTTTNCLVQLLKMNKMISGETEFRGVDYPSYINSSILNEDEIKRVDNRIQNLIFPSDATGCKESFLTNPGRVNPTHAWHEYGTKNIMLYLLRDTMDEKTRRSLLFFLSVLNRVNQYDLKENEIPLIDADLQVGLCLLERDFSISIFNITTHLIRHEPSVLLKKGPTHSHSGKFKFIIFLGVIEFFSVLISLDNDLFHLL